MKKPPARKLKPETLMMSLGYQPELSEGALKCPIFQTSTFVFPSAEEGKAFFEIAYHLRDRKPTDKMGLIYSRLNNPDLEILENRLAAWDGAEDAAVFASGLAAISTALMEFLQPGDVLLHSNPLYGGTHYFIHHVLTKFGITPIGFMPHHGRRHLRAMVKESQIEGKVGMIYVETPANPTNAIIDLKMVAELAAQLSTPERRVVSAVDNTYMGPMWQRPLQLGIDLALYSATKFIGGHSDVIAGSASGSAELIERLKALRTFMGNMCDPWAGWLLMRSLETLKLRTDRMAENALKVARFLRAHPKVENVYFPGFIPRNTEEYKVFRRQCTSAGSMISFDIKGGEAKAFRFLNALTIVKLAVSLGGTESLAEHPATMTHSDVSPHERAAMGISERLIRLSVGVEDPDDLIWDIEQALARV
jgi:methionine-gamma-lyase